MPPAHSACGSRSGHPAGSPWILSFASGAPTRAGIARHLRDWDERGRPLTAVAWSLTGLLRMSVSKGARRLHAAATTHLPFGPGLAFWHKLTGRHSSPDGLHRALFSWVGRRKKRVLLLGSASIPIVDTARRISRRFEGLDIVDAVHPAPSWCRSAWTERIARSAPQVIVAWILDGKGAEAVLELRRLLPECSIFTVFATPPALERYPLSRQHRQPRRRPTRRDAPLPIG